MRPQAQVNPGRWPVPLAPTRPRGRSNSVFEWARGEMAVRPGPSSSAIRPLSSAIRPSSSTYQPSPAAVPIGRPIAASTPRSSPPPNRQPGSQFNGVTDVRLKDNPNLPVFTYNASENTSKGKKRKHSGKDSIDSTLRKVARKLDNKHRVLKQRRQNMLKLNDSLRNLPSNSPLDRVYDRREFNVSRSFQTDAQTQTEGKTAACGCTLCPGHQRLPAVGPATVRKLASVVIAAAAKCTPAVGAAINLKNI